MMRTTNVSGDAFQSDAPALHGVEGTDRDRTKRDVAMRRVYSELVWGIGV